jgi:hypothetical protein
VRWMSAIVLVVVALAVVGNSTPASTHPEKSRSAQASFHDTSWSDSQHGWRSGTRGVLSTENGGRTWHRIGTFEVMGLVRTSPLAGAVTETCRGTGLCPTYWTRDNGRHWYLASLRLIDGAYRGSGQFLFWLGHTKLFQVKPWPPRGRAPRRCRRIRECGPPAFDGGARTKSVAQVPGGLFFELANVPGGALAVIRPDDPTMPVRVLVRRMGRNSISTLPVIPGVRLCEGYGSDPGVDWPKIVVFGCIAASRAATWVTEDGGATWQVIADDEKRDSCAHWPARGGEALEASEGSPRRRPPYASRKDIPSASSRAFWSAGTGVWNRPGMYQRKVRPKVLRWQMHLGGQPQCRPLGLWRR